MYQDAVAGGYPAAYHETQVCRQKSHGQRGRLLDAEALGLSDDQIGLRGNVSGHGRRHHPHDHFADFHGVDLVAACDHFTDTFPSKGRWTPRWFLQHAEGSQHVPEIQRGGSHANGHLVRSGAGFRFRFEMEIVD